MNEHHTYEDMLDEAATMIGMAFRHMREEGKTNAEIVQCAYNISSGITQFAAELTE